MGFRTEEIRGVTYRLWARVTKITSIERAQGRERILELGKGEAEAIDWRLDIRDACERSVRKIQDQMREQ